MESIYEAIVKMQRTGGNAVLATIISTRGSAPRKEGAKMLVTPDGSIVGTIGGGALEGRVHKEAFKLIGIAESRLVHFEMTNEDASKEGMLCGGIVDVFIEPIGPLPSLVVFGAGHISFFLARLGKMLGFRVVIVDDRPEYANAERFPEADEIIAEEFAKAREGLQINTSSYIVIVTRGHMHDSRILEWAVTMDAAYVGMIGSRKKVRDVSEMLKSKGVTAEQLGRVHAPIGLDIGAETPEEIAVSIMAEIIQIRRQGRSGGAVPHCSAPGDTGEAVKEPG